MTHPPAELAELLDTIRKNGVTNRDVLRVIGMIDRREFVDDIFAATAHDDIPLPIDRGQTISQPTIVAMMTEALEVNRSHRVLEVGTGSGYQALVLSHLAFHVYSLERHRKLALAATSMITGRHRRSNVTIVTCDGSQGLPSAAPFDRIMITAASEDVPPTLLDQLKPGGLMVLPVARSERDQRLLKIDKQASGLIYTELGRVRFVPLVEGVDHE